MTIYGKLITTAFLILVGTGIWYFAFKPEAVEQVQTSDTATTTYTCNADGKVCPDGSIVGRTGPMCEFSECPGVFPATSTPHETIGILNGHVTLSPTCPVETNPPDPNCAPRAYVTEVSAINKLTGDVTAHTKTTKEGFYVLDLPVGDYTIRATSASVYPRCSDIDVSVKGNKTTTVDISCDSGIR